MQYVKREMSKIRKSENTMRIFLDTSSLFKIYHQEEGSDELLMFLDSTEIEEIYISEISLVEFKSIIYRRVRMGEFSEEFGSELLNTFESTSHIYELIELNREIVEIAKKMFDVYGLRGLKTLDAIQFASAIKVKKEISKFFTHDLRLRTFFLEEFKEI